MSTAKKKKHGGPVKTRGEGKKPASTATLPKVSALLRTELEAFASQYQITPREREVLMWMAAGHGSADELAAILGRSVNTVQNHIKGLLRGTGTNSKTAVLALFIDHLLSGSAQGASAKRKAPQPWPLAKRKR